MCGWHQEILSSICFKFEEESLKVGFSVVVLVYKKPFVYRNEGFGY